MRDASPGSSAPTDGSTEPAVVDWVLHDIDWLVTCDPQMTCIPNGALAIDADAIAAVGATAPVVARYRGRNQVNLSGHLVLPGLVNAHVHAAMTCFRGLGSDLPLERWLHEVIFPAEAAHVNPELVYWGTLLGCVEMLQNGVTTFCDGYFFEESAVRAVVEAGSRAVLGQGVLDFPTPDQPDPTHSRERAESFLAAFPHHAARLRPSLFCHAPYTCGAETLGWVKQLCRDQGILFQIHLSETASEVHALRARHGMSPVRYLEQLGILDEGTLCAHCVWVEPEEIAILARCRVGVAHDPESNMKLAAGVAPVPRLLAAGIAVGLGTDGCASNDDLDILAEMDRAAKLHKVFEGNPVVCSAPEVLRMGTCWGAAAIGWGDRIGSLEAGKNADLVAIDLDRPHLTPLYNPVSQLVYAARGSDVRHVWVAGRQVVTDGAVRTVDVADILREVNRIAERVRFS